MVISFNFKKKLSLLYYILRKVLTINPLKTLWLNFYILPFMTACKFPIIIYKGTKLSQIKKGGIIFNCPIKMGILQIGSHSVGTIDFKYSRTIWQTLGKVVIHGMANIGAGSRISVGKDAILSLGDNFTITGQSSIICQNRVSFGHDCLLSWDILIMDTDFHKIIAENGQIINSSSPIMFGNHIWIGCRNTILKGVIVADHVVLASGSTITRSIEESNIVFGGNGKYARVLKSNITWEV